MKGGTRLSSVIIPGLILVIAFLVLSSIPPTLGRKSCSRGQCGGPVVRGPGIQNCCRGYTCVSPKKHGAWGKCVRDGPPRPRPTPPPPPTSEGEGSEENENENENESASPDYETKRRQPPSRQKKKPGGNRLKIKISNDDYY